MVDTQLKMVDTQLDNQEYSEKVFKKNLFSRLKWHPSFLIFCNLDRNLEVIHEKIVSVILK